ncbi:hypothetical protein PCASD_09167 [Puccinia coronata f. sp. avenae]|uniref:Uncharacterized protein n=1 Tax=Puccinia coronata f. sp. avenae TaxID=200324 RepID=A0A2N5V4I1_9BASI|nr:hypothetical protein PCASD_09167 [Puccinia coronata f. sp. avenae]
MLWLDIHSVELGERWSEIEHSGHTLPSGARASPNRALIDLARLGPDKLIIHYLSLIHLGHIPGSHALVANFPHTVPELLKSPLIRSISWGCPITGVTIDRSEWLGVGGSINRPALGHAEETIT